MPEDAPEDARARRRFMMISLVRFGGVFVILGAVLAANGALPFAVPDMAAYAAVMLGMGLVFVAPTLLSRRWSTNSRR